MPTNEAPIPRAHIAKDAIDGLAESANGSFRRFATTRGIGGRLIGGDYGVARIAPGVPRPAPRDEEPVFSFLLVPADLKNTWTQPPAHCCRLSTCSPLRNDILGG